MKWFNNMKIGNKLIFAFIIIALFAGAVGAIGIINLININSNSATMYNNMTVPISYASDMATKFQQIRVATRDVIILKTQMEIKTEKDRISILTSEINKLAGSFEKSISSPQMQDVFNAYVTARDAYLPYQDMLIKLAEQNNDDEAYALFKGDLSKAATDEMNAIENLVNLKVADAGMKNQANDQISNQSILILSIVVAAAVVLAILLGIYISRIISRPIKFLVSASKQLALGEIDLNVEAKTKDEIGDLMESFGQMIHNIREQALTVEKIASGDLTVKVAIHSEKDVLGNKLQEMLDKNNEVLQRISTASEQVLSGSNLVSQSSMTLSQGTTEQASAIQQLTAGLEDIAVQTKQNAQNAEQSNELAQRAQNNALKGNDHMRNMLSAMDDINQSSSNINKIIKVIDDIAFQTNILALNAAVEAARAGQHGKGFAVVAEEVRTLAAKSANAVKETTDMIENSIRKVDSGTKIANETAEALKKIVDEIEKVASLVNSIATSSGEQTVAIDQINSAVSQVSQVVQTNAATAEESAAASEELSAQAMQLKDNVRIFRIREFSGITDAVSIRQPDTRAGIRKLSGKHMLEKQYQTVEPDLNFDGCNMGKY